MPSVRKSTITNEASQSPAGNPGALDERVRRVLAELERLGTDATREGMARFAIHADKAFGVRMPEVQRLGKRIGRDHKLAAALWKTGWYEARILTAFIDDPALVTPAQMDRWCGEFDNWAVCDTLCFKLFERTPHAWSKVEQWSGDKREFVKRAAFALLAGLAVHDKKAGDERFLAFLPLVERAATDERNFVKKGVNWALRTIGKRNPALNEAAVEVARRLAESADQAARWVGRDALRELTSAAVITRLQARAMKKSSAKRMGGETRRPS